MDIIWCMFNNRIWLLIFNLSILVLNRIFFFRLYICVVFWFIWNVILVCSVFFCKWVRLIIGVVYWICLWRIKWGVLFFFVKLVCNILWCVIILANIWFSMDKFRLFCICNVEGRLYLLLFWLSWLINYNWYCVNDKVLWLGGFMGVNGGVLFRFLEVVVMLICCISFLIVGVLNKVCIERLMFRVLWIWEMIWVVSNEWLFDLKKFVLIFIFGNFNIWY